MMTVAALIDWIERQFPVGQSTDTARSVTGEPYVVIGAQADGMAVIPGTVDEGEARELAFDEETACLMAAHCFRDYAEGRKGTLYWRNKPVLDQDEKSDRCVVYMRCLISDRDAQA